jgi:predicted DNA binding protein
MVLVAEILLADRTLPLVGLAEAIPSGELSISNPFILNDNKIMMTVTVDTDSRDAFDREMDSATEIIDAMEIGQTADGWFYQLIVKDDSNLAQSHDPEEIEGVVMDATVTSEGIREQKVFSDYESLATLRDRCKVHDIPFELLRIASDPENDGERDQFGLTDKQYRAISNAFAEGYYDSPRTFSTDDLASELDVSAAAASDLLRRAEKQLISETVGPQQYMSVLPQ